MNKDQVKGTIKLAVGKTQKKIGEVTGNTKEQAAGARTALEGKTQKLVGDMKALVKDAVSKP